MQINAATLRRLRQDRGMTQNDLAKRVRVTFSYISKLESGDRPSGRSNPSEQVVKRLSRVLGVPEFVLRFEPDAATAYVAELALTAKRAAAADAASVT